MREKAVISALFIVAIMAGPILAASDYEYGMSSLGFANLTIGNTFYENVEYVFNATKGYPSEGCQHGLTLAVLPSLELVKLPKGFELFDHYKSSEYGCYVGARHSANPNAKLLTRAQIYGGLDQQEFDKLDFNWYIDGQRFGAVNVSYVRLNGMSDKAKVRQLAYHVLFENGRLSAVPVRSDWGSVCCMRLPFNSSVAPSRPTLSFPLFPLIHLGRHDVTIKGREYKNIPYFYLPSLSFQTHPKERESYCPAGLKHAIIPSKNFVSPYPCSVAVGFVGNPDLAPGEDLNNVTVRRSLFQWVLNYEEAGAIADELWDGRYEPPRFFLQEKYIGYGKNGLYTFDTYYDDKGSLCCMDLPPDDHNDPSFYEHSPSEHSPSAGPILATRLDYNEYGMTSLGFSNLTIGNTFYENVEYILNTSGAVIQRCQNELVLDLSQGCQNGLVPAVLPSLELRELPKGFQLLEDLDEKLIGRRGCYVGARHEANPSAKLLTRAQIYGGLYRQEFEKLDFHWYLDGQRYGKVNVSYMELHRGWDKAKVRQLAYNVWFQNGRLHADKSAKGSVCCMRLPSKVSVVPSLPTPYYPLFPLIHLGRHDVTIKGREYKDIPYFYYQKEGESYCPAGLKHAIIPSKKFVSPYDCSVSGGFIGSPTLAPGEDPKNVTVKRSRFQWVLDYEEAGAIPDELWRENQPEDDWNELQERYIGYGWNGLSTIGKHATIKHSPCCMDLSADDHNDPSFYQHGPSEHSSSTTAPNTTTSPIKGI